MPRATNAPASRRRRKRRLEQAKGFYGSRSKLFRQATEAVDRAMRLATIPAGYSDGLTMEPTEPQIRITAGFSYWGVINGKKAYFAGKTGIVHTLLDVTDIPEAKPGVPVALHVRRTAANARIPRIYK